VGIVLDAVRRRAALDRGVLPNGITVQACDVPDNLIQKAGEEIGKAAEAKPDEAWKIFRFGTDEEFAVLVNQIDELGKEFESEKALMEVMNLAKQRGTPTVIEETRIGFGVLFEHFWNDSADKVKSRSFNQVKRVAEPA